MANLGFVQNDHYLALNSYNDIADLAWFLYENCRKNMGGSPPDDIYLSGQAFTADGWNVIVRADDC